MAESKPSSAPRAKAKRVERVKVRAGGFVGYADPPPPTPKPIIPCSVCGAQIDKDGCPRGHGKTRGGWAVADEGD